MTTDCHGGTLPATRLKHRLTIAIRRHAINDYTHHASYSNFIGQPIIKIVTKILDENYNRCPFQIDTIQINDLCALTRGYEIILKWTDSSVPFQAVVQTLEMLQNQKQESFFKHNKKLTKSSEQDYPSPIPMR